MDTTFKQAALAEESALNATFCLPCSGSKQLGNKTLDVMQQGLPNIDAASCLSEPDLMPKANLPTPPTEPGNLSDLFTSFVTEECLQIVAQLSNKSETCPGSTPDALNPCPASHVSLLDEEPMPFDCSVYSRSEMSATKSPQVHSTSKFTENSLKLTQCQLINIEDEVKDNYFSDQYIDSETLPSLGNLIQFDETVLVSNSSDLVGNVPEPKLEARSRNVVRQSPTLIDCTTPLAVENLTTSDGAKEITGTSNMSSKDEFLDKSANPEKTSKLSLSKTGLLLCEGSVLTDPNPVVPMPAAPIDFVQSFAEGDLIHLNETITLTGENATFDALKQESSFGNDFPAAILPNVEISLPLEDAVALNEVKTEIDKNLTFISSIKAVLEMIKQLPQRVASYLRPRMLNLNYW
ncbi:uncharacterized protein [Narcine bancroftii]|uniref:uncharacterized protein n=1 Tax=Narcine bancroftii TaxID=1343680 RepID=UPI0038311E2E